jgi:hypothetical protein
VNRGGFVYLMALLVILVVAGIAMLLASGGGLRLRAGNGNAAREDCRSVALGVLRAVVNDLDTTMSAGGLPALTTVVADGETVGNCTVLLIGRDPAATKAIFGLIPEAGRIDINAASPAQIAALPGLDVSIAAAIVDWRDTDDEPLENGAERGDGTYTGAITSYAPRNAPIETLEELRLVRGVTDTMWFGEDINRNGRLDNGEDADSDGKLDPGLVDLLSLNHREPINAPGRGSTARTSINNFGLLRVWLNTLFGTERAAALATQVQATQPFANRLDLIAALDLNDGEAATLWPYLIGPENRYGLLDAASCREEVLIAAVGKDVAARIIAARSGATPGDPAWLAEALGRDLARIAGMVLTVGSYWFEADLLAVRNDGSGWARLDAIIDCSTGQARVVSIRPAEVLGWPLPWATPERLRSAAPGDVAAFLATGQP